METLGNTAVCDREKKVKKSVDGQRAICDYGSVMNGNQQAKREGGKMNNWCTDVRYVSLSVAAYLTKRGWRYGKILPAVGNVPYMILVWQ